MAPQSTPSDEFKGLLRELEQTIRRPVDPTDPKALLMLELDRDALVQRLLGLMQAADESGTPQRDLRVPCNLQANLLIGPREETAVVRALSFSGATVTTRATVSAGTLIGLELVRKRGVVFKSLIVDARVVFAANDQVGLVFEDPDYSSKRALMELVVDLLRPAAG